MARSKEKIRVRAKWLANAVLASGALLITAGLCIVAFTFFPLIQAELAYFFRQNVAPTAVRPPQEIKPVDTSFGIVIPKLGANARIIANVDPFDAAAYQQALTRGVAHARGTGYPGTMGNMFLFAHSSENFYEAIRYNSVFYLLPKLVVGDTIILYYNGAKFTYKVSGKKLVDPKDVSYLSLGGNASTLTLMTCWPPGTTLKRLLVFGKLVTN